MYDAQHAMSVAPAMGPARSWQRCVVFWSPFSGAGVSDMDRFENPDVRQSETSVKHERKRLQRRSLLIAAAIAGVASPALSSAAQLGKYSFTGTSTGDNQLNAVDAQPTNSTFSTFTRTGVAWTGA